MTVSLTARPVRKSLLVHASPEDAFDVFTEDIDSWWPRTHHIGKVPMQRVIIEPKASGRCYTVQVDGTECDWGRVLAWDPPARFVMSWYPGKDDSQATELEVRFTAEGSGTRVDLEHRGWEILAEEGQQTRDNYDSGWPTVLGYFESPLNG